MQLQATSRFPAAPIPPALYDLLEERRGKERDVAMPNEKEMERLIADK